MKNPFLFLFLCVFFTATPVTYGHSQTGESGKIITGFVVSGLKRTKPHVVDTLLEPFVGRGADSLDLKEVHAAILDTGILEPLTVEIADTEGGATVLAVSVREKWSIFPMPIFFAGSGNINGGLFFVDTNAFGLNDKFFLGGMYGVSGWLLMSAYMHSGRRGFPGWHLSASFERSERNDTNQRDEDIRRFGIESGGVSAGLSHNFTEALNAGLSFSYRQLMLKESDAALSPPDSDARAFGVNTDLSLRKSYWDGFLLSQESLSADYGFTVGLEGFTFHKLSLRGTYQKSLKPGFRVNLHTGLLYQPDVPVLFESSPQAAQVNILPASFNARHYAGASFGFEKYLFKISTGTVSFMTAYQLVFSEGPVLGSCFDHGLACSLVFYLSKLAIPAIGLGLAYDVSSAHLLFSFSLGMSF
jgi:hypothetical protein